MILKTLLATIISIPLLMSIPFNNTNIIKNTPTKIESLMKEQKLNKNDYDKLMNSVPHNEIKKYENKKYKKPFLNDKMVIFKNTDGIDDGMIINKNTDGIDDGMVIIL